MLAPLNLILIFSVLEELSKVKATDIHCFAEAGSKVLTSLLLDLFFFILVASLPGLLANLAREILKTYIFLLV